METTIIASLASILTAGGPYGFVAILCWAFWRVNEKKDRELKVLTQKVVRMAEEQTQAISKVEAALVSLQRVIEASRKNTP